MNLSSKVKNYRNYVGLNKTAFSKLIGIDIDTLYKIENTEDYLPSYKVLKKLSSVLDISIPELLVDFNTSKNVFKITWENNKKSIIFLSKDISTGDVLVFISNLKLIDKKYYKFSQIKNLISNIEKLKYI